MWKALKRGLGPGGWTWLGLLVLLPDAEPMLLVPGESAPAVYSRHGAA